MRGRSYTPSPPRGYSRRGRSPSPRGRYGGHARDLPTSLLVRNLRLDCRPDDLRRPFGQFGPLKDIYLPRDYYTGEPRGFGFVQFVDPGDASEAKYHMDGQILYGREITVVFAEENRKRPTEMRARERGGSRRYRDRGSPPQYSRSPPPRHARLQSHERDYYSPPPKRRTYSRSVSPQDRRYSRERSYSRPYSRSPINNGLRSRSQSPVRGLSCSQGTSRSPNPRLSRSPNNFIRESNGDRSPTP